MKPSVLSACICAMMMGASPSLAQSTLRPIVVDSTGKSVGYFLSGSAVVLTPPGTPQLLTLFYATGFFEPAGNQVYPDHYFKSSDCSGKAYLLAASVPISAYVNPANDRFFEYPSTPEKAVFHSIKQYYRGAPPCIANATTTIYAGPTTALSINSLGFRPPFSIRFN